MSSFPGATAILAAYLDQTEALEHLLHARTVVSADPRSRFHGLSGAEIQDRLEEAREELDRWTVLVLVASFEATLRADAMNRIKVKTKDAVRLPLRDLHKEHEGRVRLDDIREIWDGHATPGATLKQSLGTLLRHRHWLAHGRHWVNKHGAIASRSKRTRPSTTTRRPCRRPCQTSPAPEPRLP